MTDDGEVVCGLVELEEKYRLLANRTMPLKGDLEALMASAKRWGIVRKGTDSDTEVAGSELDGQPFVIMIRPAIVDILGETALQRLAQWPKQGTDLVNSIDEDQIADKAGMEEL
jgi:hypothetical protein